MKKSKLRVILGLFFPTRLFRKHPESSDMTKVLIGYKIFNQGYKANNPGFMITLCLPFIFIKYYNNCNI